MLDLRRLRLLSELRRHGTITALAEALRSPSTVSQQAALARSPHVVGTLRVAAFQTAVLALVPPALRRRP